MALRSYELRAAAGSAGSAGDQEEASREWSPPSRSMFESL